METPAKPCPCGEGNLTYKTAFTSQNMGRGYYTCPKKVHCKGGYEGCGFWVWRDELKVCPCGRGFCYVKACGKKKTEYRCPQREEGCGYRAPVPMAATSVGETSSPTNSIQSVTVTSSATSVGETSSPTNSIQSVTVTSSPRNMRLDIELNSVASPSSSDDPKLTALMEELEKTKMERDVARTNIDFYKSLLKDFKKLELD